MKRLVISLIVVCMFAPIVLADGWDTNQSRPARRASEVMLLNSGCDWFSNGVLRTHLRNLMLAMEGWANRTSPSDGWWNNDYFTDGYIGTQDNFTRTYNALHYWTNNTQGMELYAMGEGDRNYMTNGSLGQQVNVGSNMSYADKTYAYASDLVVGSAASNHVSLGYYFGRNNTTWGSSSWVTSSDPNHPSTTEMVKFITGGTEFTFYAAATTTPIVLDMDGDGKLEASNGEWLAHELAVKPETLVQFDMNADGFVEATEWVGPNDGLLVEYEGGDITAKNLFGSEGGKYRDGFEKLALLDKDGDKKLTGDELKTLKVWLDKNVNAKVDDGEISAVSDLAITEISVEQKNLVSSFVKDGKTLTAWDWNPCFAMVKKEK